MDNGGERTVNGHAVSKYERRLQQLHLRFKEKCADGDMFQEVYIEPKRPRQPLAVDQVDVAEDIRRRRGLWWRTRFPVVGVRHVSRATGQRELTPKNLSNTIRSVLKVEVEYHSRSGREGVDTEPAEVDLAKGSSNVTLTNVVTTSVTTSGKMMLVLARECCCDWF